RGRDTLPTRRSSDLSPRGEGREAKRLTPGDAEEEEPRTHGEQKTARGVEAAGVGGAAVGQGAQGERNQGQGEGDGDPKETSPAQDRKSTRLNSSHVK